MTERSTTQRHWGVFLALSIAALGSTLGGCNADSYYCPDDTRENRGLSCQFCDGVGCRAATPPQRAQCRGDFECATGQICTNHGCASSCRANTDCARGWVCRIASGGTSGMCVAPGEEITPNPGSCQGNADCGGGYVCVNGTCSPSTTPACTADTSCTGGRVCVGGRCTQPADTCQFNNQCGANRVCINGQCRAQCGAGGPQCETGQTCVDGVCQITPDGCTSDAGCEGGRCIDRTCYSTCTPGPMSSCAAGRYCSDDGVCVLDTRPHPFCDAAHPCQAGSDCVGGICRIPCTTSTQCAQVDVNFRNCGAISYLNSPRTYCLTDREFRPVCTRQSMCGAGQNCVDGACQ